MDGIGGNGFAVHGSAMAERGLRCWGTALLGGHGTATAMDRTAGAQHSIEKKRSGIAWLGDARAKLGMTKQRQCVRRNAGASR